MTTIGANVLAIFVVPNGWIANNKTRMVHDTPMIVAVVTFGCATRMP
jgi:hypothetical protein